MASDLASSASAATPVAIVLNAVLAVVENGQPKTLCVRGADGALGLPYGPFDPARHRTFEIGLREWVARQTNVPLGYVEQLYTFGDRGRDAPSAAIVGGDARARVVSVGYLAIAPEPAKLAGQDAQWRSWYEFFPWEDWRRGEPASLSPVLDALTRWIGERDSEAEQTERGRRVALAFGLGANGWEEERALERYEMMYEAGLVREAWRDRDNAPPADREGALAASGVAMASDHRRILATAIARVRGKLKYRPVLFDFAPDVFTLLSLQKIVEALVGFDLHKQNFRRSVDQSGLVEKTRETVQQASGRPAALFRAATLATMDGAPQGLAIPRLKRRPSAGGALADEDPMADWL
jgi:hypothetical protein